MTWAGTFAITTASVGLLAALLALGMSTAPGWRELRWFAACAAAGALFSLANAPVTMSGLSNSFLVVASRLNLCFGALHVAAWIKYVAAHEQRKLTRIEQGLVGGGLLWAALALVPRLIVTNSVYPRPVEIGNIELIYRDCPPTALGDIAIAYYTLVVGYLFFRAIWRWRRGNDTFARTQAIALGAVCVGGIHDGLASADVIRSPYLTDLSLLVLVLSVGGSITSSFVASARALESSSRKLEQTAAQLVKRERLAALGELSAVVAHEVRNPLAVVFNAIAGLRKSRSNEHEALVNILQEEAERLRDIVSDLLEFASPRPPILQEASLDEIVRGAVDAARSVVGAAEDDVVIDGQLETAQLECDERLVRQAVLNLVTNALQASGRNGPVRVSIDDHAPHDALAVRVTDDGDGVPAELRERVFTPFFSTRPKGTGLGLAVVRRCAEAHGGRVSLGSNGDRGASFELLLPRRATDSIA